MSKALYPLGSLRFWDENEIELREMFQQRAVSTVKRALTTSNPAWRYFRMEGPILTPEALVSSEHIKSGDVFTVSGGRASVPLVLRAETTGSSYAYARNTIGKMPICVWQSGKSFRTESSDGASPSKLRFNEFWQLEFQCIYADTTKADYRDALIKALTVEIARFTGKNVRTVASDRLPVYSSSTLDIEVEYAPDKWREMASCSTRTDYAVDMLVCEIAIGLDRIVAMSSCEGI
jgi:glycyl-tRNA synthetase